VYDTCCNNVCKRPTPYDYVPCGNLRIPKGHDSFEGHKDLTVISESIVSNPILFAGYFYDNETGLYYVRHRMYSPTLQRRLQRNPLRTAVSPLTVSAAISLHLSHSASVELIYPYQYISGNPVRGTDPRGLCVCKDERSPFTAFDCCKINVVLERGCAKALEICAKDAWILGADLLTCYAAYLPALELGEAGYLGCVAACNGAFDLWLGWRLRECFDTVHDCFESAKEQKCNCIEHAQDCEDFDPEMNCFDIAG